MFALLSVFGGAAAFEVRKRVAVTSERRELQDLRQQQQKLDTVLEVGEMLPNGVLLCLLGCFVLPQCPWPANQSQHLLTSARFQDPPFDLHPHSFTKGYTKVQLSSVGRARLLCKTCLDTLTISHTCSKHAPGLTHGSSSPGTQSTAV